MSHEANDRIWESAIEKLENSGLRYEDFERIVNSWTFEDACQYLGVES